jgi:hypothetical protein
MKQTCYISIWNWQCYITIGEVVKLVSAHMGGDCCTLCVILHRHIPHINKTLHQVAKKSCLNHCQPPNIQACSSNNMNIFCLTMVLIQIDWQIQFHYRKGGWGINHLQTKKNMYDILKANIKKIWTNKN